MCRNLPLIQVSLIVVAVAARCSAAPAGQKLPGETMRLKGHAEAVTAVAISADGTRIVTGSVDRTAILWDSATGNLLRRLEGHANVLTAVGFSGDGKRIVTGSCDRTARVWDAATGDLLADLKGGHLQHVHTAAISPDGKRVLTGSCEQTAVLWDVDQEKQIQRYRHPGEVHAVAFAPDGKTFVTASRGPGLQLAAGSLCLYDAATGVLLKGFETEGVNCLAYVDGGKRAFVFGAGRNYCLDVAGQTLESLHVPVIGGGLAHAGPSGDGRRILARSKTNNCLVDLELGMVVQFYPAQEFVRSTVISPDGTWGVIAVGGREAPWTNTYVPSVERDAVVVSLPRELGETKGAATPTSPTYVEKFAATPDGGRLFTVQRDGRATWWDTVSRKPVARLRMNPSDLLPYKMAAAISADGTRSAVATRDGPVQIYNQEGKVVASVRERGSALALALPKDERVVFVGGDRSTARPNPKVPPSDIEVHQFDVVTGQVVRNFGGPPGVVRQLTVSPDGKTLLALFAVSTGGPKSVGATAWDVATGRRLWVWSKPGVNAGLTTETAAPAISGDGKSVAFAFDAAGVVLDMENGKPLVELRGYKERIRHIAFDPGGKRIWTLATGAATEAVRSWDPATGKQLSASKTIPGSPGVFRFADGGGYFVEAKDGTLTRHRLEE